MHPQTDSRFFSLPLKIRTIIQREYLKQHPEIKATGHLLPPVKVDEAERSWIERYEIELYKSKGVELGGAKMKWYKGLSIAHPLMLTCVKMYKEMCPMAFENLTIRFPPCLKQQLPLKMVLPPPRRCLRNLTLIVDARRSEMREYEGLALHLLGSPSLHRFTVEGKHGADWFHGPTSALVSHTELRALLEQRRDQRVIQVPQGQTLEALFDMALQFSSGRISSQSFVFQ